MVKDEGLNEKGLWLKVMLDYFGADHALAKDIGLDLVGSKEVFESIGAHSWLQI